MSSVKRSVSSAPPATRPAPSTWVTSPLMVAPAGTTVTSLTRTSSTVRRVTLSPTLLCPVSTVFWSDARISVPVVNVSDFSFSAVADCCWPQPTAQRATAASTVPTNARRVVAFRVPRFIVVSFRFVRMLRTATPQPLRSFVPPLGAALVQQEERDPSDQRDHPYDRRYRESLVFRRRRLEVAHLEDRFLVLVVDPAVDQRDDPEKDQCDSDDLHPGIPPSPRSRWACGLLSVREFP